MANKAQKRNFQRYKEEIKSREEKLNNLSETEIYQLENYAVFQILYVNDIAYNCCKFLEKELDTVQYKSNAVRKVYGALMKRWNAYREFIKLTGMDQDMVANLFCEMDEYMDAKVTKVQRAITEVLEREEIDYAHWVANCESAATICEYAVEISLRLIEKLSNISKRISILKQIVIAEPARVMVNMSEMVQNIHVRKEIDLNKEDTIQAAFRQLNKAFCNPENFKSAQTTADKVNISEGRDTIM